MNTSSKGHPSDLNFKSVEDLEGSPWWVVGHNCLCSKYYGVFTS